MDNPTNISIVENDCPLQWRDFLLENEWCNDKKKIGNCLFLNSYHIFLLKLTLPAQRDPGDSQPSFPFEMELWKAVVSLLPLGLLMSKAYHPLPLCESWRIWKTPLYLRKERGFHMCQDSLHKHIKKITFIANFSRSPAFRLFVSNYLFPIH